MMRIAALLSVVLAGLKLYAVISIGWAIVILPVLIAMTFEVLMYVAALYCAAWLAMLFYRNTGGRVPPTLRKPFDQTHSRVSGHRIH